MVYANKFNRESTELYNIACLNSIELRLTFKCMLCKLVGYDTNRKARAVYRGINGFEDIGKCTDMVLVTVSYNKTAYLVDVFFKVSSNLPLRL